MTYFASLPRELNILIASKLRLIDDLSVVSDLFNLRNADYMHLCSIYHPTLFPVKFIYGDIPERYNWCNLYNNFLNEDLYECNIITCLIYGPQKISDNLAMNHEIVLFLVLIGRIPLIKTRKFLQSLFKDANTGGGYFYSSHNYIEANILPMIYEKIFETNRWRFIPQDQLMIILKKSYRYVLLSEEHLKLIDK